jgi:Uma2 family endonuclease
MRQSTDLRTMTVAEFLAFEKASRVRHEYVRGEAFAMSGGTSGHSQITGNIFAHLKTAAKGGPCHIVVNDVLVRADQDHLYYPDVAVECIGRSGDKRVLDAPCVVIEVTSKSTRRTDRVEKLENYRRIESLELYLIIDQMRRRVTRHLRDSGEWRSEEIEGDGAVAIPGVGTSLTLDVIYEGVEFPPLSVVEAEAFKWGEDED